MGGYPFPWGGDACLPNKQWYVDINGRSHSVLPLNSVNLPYGELRRRKDDDALNMRALLEEDDLFRSESTPRRSVPERYTTVVLSFLRRNSYTHYPILVLCFLLSFPPPVG